MLLLQQYFTIKVGVHFHSRLHKKQLLLTPEFRHCNQIPLRLCWTLGVLVADVLVHFKFHKVVRQQT